MFKCSACKDTGVIDTGNNDFPCKCSAGDTALFNVAGVTGQVSGAVIKSGIPTTAQQEAIAKAGALILNQLYKVAGVPKKVYAENSVALQDLHDIHKTLYVKKDGEMVGVCILVDVEKSVAYKLNPASGEIERVEGVEVEIGAL